MDAIDLRYLIFFFLTEEKYQTRLNVCLLAKVYIVILHHVS